MSNKITPISPMAHYIKPTLILLYQHKGQHEVEKIHQCLNRQITQRNKGGGSNPYYVPLPEITKKQMNSLIIHLINKGLIQRCAHPTTNNVQNLHPTSVKLTPKGEKYIGL